MTRKKNNYINVTIIYSNITEIVFHELNSKPNLVYLKAHNPNYKSLFTWGDRIKR